MAKPRGLSVIDRTGHRYNRLLVLSRAPNIETPNGPVTQWHCRCDCGTEVFVRGPGLAKGARGKGGTQSCGCLNRENAPIHGKARSRVYGIWQLMVQRSTNPNSDKWAHYGGRGITVCDAWRAFPAFYADMGDPAPGMTLDRIDNDKGYGPDNCRWATRQTQGNNRRSNVFLSFKGRKMTIADWARETGISKSALNNRLADNWPVERALTEPLAARAPRKPSSRKDTT